MCVPHFPFKIIRFHNVQYKHAYKIIIHIYNIKRKHLFKNAGNDQCKKCLVESFY